MGGCRTRTVTKPGRRLATPPVTLYFVRRILHDPRPVPSPRPKSNRTPLRVWQTRALTGMATWEEGPFLLSFYLYDWTGT